MQQHGESKDPYRTFFPLGIILGTLGVSIWPLYYYGLTPGYSGRAHAFVQTDGFLFAFIAGFLLTAVPRFTGTETPSRRVQYVLAAIVICCAAAFEFQFFVAGQSIFVIEHVFLLVLLIRRFLRRRQDPPETFPLVGIGLLSGTLAALINAGVAWNVIGPAWDPLGKRLLTEGMVLLLVLGIGGFLGPRLMGFAQLPQFTNIRLVDAEPASKKALLYRKALLYKVAGLSILLSLIAECGFGIAAMAFVRAAAASIVILSTVQPWKLPAVRTTLARCVWCANWFVILSVWVVAFVPHYRIDFLHILFIGGFTLLILAVGTRVTLSHGGHGIAKERRSWPLRVAITTGLIAMLARVGAPFAGFTYFAHLAWAAILWMIGMLVWGVFVFRLIRTRPAAQLPE
jgi:uncharacterized protein involved in response to NO